MSSPASSTLFDPAERRKLAEAALRSITASTARARGTEFLRILVHDLAEALDVTYVIAGRVITMPDGTEGIRTLAVWAGNDYLPNMEYSLQHTPCQDVTCQTMCFHGSGIQADYPLDTLLVEMRAESYVGMPLIDTEGKTLGILSAIDTKPIDEDKHLLALSLLSIFAARAAAELQHQDREQALQRMVAERTDALRAAQGMLVEQEKVAALGTLVAGIAHEINTPVGVAVTAASGLSGYAERLVAALAGPKVSRGEISDLADKLQRAAGLIEANLGRAAELITNFKQLAVDQSGGHVTRMVLREHVYGVAIAHSPELKKADIEVELRIPDTLVVWLPCGPLGQLLSNLLMNTVHHAYPGGGPGRVVIVAELEDGQWLNLQFMDDGIGLAPGVREHVFEPFFTTKRGQGGSGLGLHIVYTIVHQLGGQIHIDDAVALGCSIRIRLPITQPE